MKATKWDWFSRLSHLVLIRHECPRCKSVKFKPAELRPIDDLLVMFALRPVRCMFCWRRYHWFAFHVVDVA